VLLLDIDALLADYAERGKKAHPQLTARRVRIIQDYFIENAESLLHGPLDQEKLDSLIGAFARVAGVSWEQFKRERLEKLAAKLKEETGTDTTGLESAQNLEAFIQNLYAKAEAQQQDEQAERDRMYEQFEAQFDGRKNHAQFERARAREDKKAQKRHAEEEQAKAEIKQSLRELMRKLVSALHPDREPDAAERERKTELMKRVNDAYERNDLLTLLSLQLEIEQIQAADIANFSDERIKQYIRVLEDQLRALRDEQAGMRQSILHWVYSRNTRVYLTGSPSSNANLERLLKARVRDAEQALEQVQTDHQLFSLPHLRISLIDRWERAQRYADGTDW
jgi:hypothetical protein